MGERRPCQAPWQNPERLQSLLRLESLLRRQPNRRRMLLAHLQWQEHPKDRPGLRRRPPNWACLQERRRACPPNLAKVKARRPFWREAVCQELQRAKEEEPRQERLRRQRQRWPRPRLVPQTLVPWPSA